MAIYKGDKLLANVGLTEFIESDPIYTADKLNIALKSEVQAITDLIPNQASDTNQLADKDFVNDAISEIEARYVTPDPAGLMQWESLTTLQTGSWYSGGVPHSPTQGDYAIFINVDGSVWRAKYNDNLWTPTYKINDTPFTSEQLAALNSGITSDLIETFERKNSPLLLATSTTAAGTAIKVASTPGNVFKRIVGARCGVVFTAANWSSNPQLNIDGTGAALIRFAGVNIMPRFIEVVNMIYIVRWDGTHYQLENPSDYINTWQTSPIQQANGEVFFHRARATHPTGIDWVVPRYYVDQHLPETVNLTATTNSVRLIQFGDGYSMPWSWQHPPRIRFAAKVECLTSGSVPTSVDIEVFFTMDQEGNGKLDEDGPWRAYFGDSELYIKSSHIPENCKFFARQWIDHYDYPDDDNPNIIYTEMQVNFELCMQTFRQTIGQVYTVKISDHGVGSSDFMIQQFLASLPPVVTNTPAWVECGITLGTAWYLYNWDTNSNVGTDRMLLRPDNSNYRLSSRAVAGNAADRYFRLARRTSNNSRGYCKCWIRYWGSTSAGQAFDIHWGFNNGVKSRASLLTYGTPASGGNPILMQDANWIYLCIPNSTNLNVCYLNMSGEWNGYIREMDEVIQPDPAGLTSIPWDNNRNIFA